MSRPRHLLAVAAASAVLAATGCSRAAHLAVGTGGADGESVARQPMTSTGQSISNTTAHRTESNVVTSADASKPLSSRRGSTSPQPTATPEPVHEGLPIHIAFSSACLKPGGLQHITVTTVPDAGVVYDAVYSDNKHGGSKGYYGGNESGHTDANGVWRSSWVVGPQAPPGFVRVDVLGIARLPQGVARGYSTAYFTVAGTTGSCA